MPASTQNWHYTHGPSSLKETKMCPGRKRMMKMAGIANKDSFASKEGHWMHEASEFLDTDLLSSPVVIAELEVLARNDGKPYNDAVREEEKTQVMKALNFVSGLLVDVKEHCKEELVFLHSKDGCKSYLDLSGEELVEVFDKHLITAGSCDGFIVHNSGHATQYDYKFGRFKVMAKGNIQMMAYACASMELHPDVNSVTPWIIQPRLNHYDEGDTYYREDLPKYRKIIKDIVDRADGKELILNPSRDACYFCSGKEICSAYKEVNRVSAVAVRNNESNLMSKDVNVLAPAIKTATKIIDNAKSLVMEKIKSGVEIEGVRLQAGRKTVEVTDQEGLFTEMVKYGLKTEDLIKCSSISSAKIVELYVETAYGKCFDDAGKKVTKKALRDMMTGHVESNFCNVKTGFPFLVIK